MKSLKLCPNKANKIIIDGFKNNKSSDEVYKEVVSNLGLFGVAFLGHGTKYQKLKCTHIWRNVLFILYDFSEFKHLTNENQKSEIKRFLDF